VYKSKRKQIVAKKDFNNKININKAKASNKPNKKTGI
jgi:hypothetical protein